MESPTLTLSRIPSQTFAPGPHRRSHPNLHHLSLIPLTPKYPIDPADYDAYSDPLTSQLHTSSSLSHIATLPSPGGILTNSPSRGSSHSRSRLSSKRKTKSTVSFQHLPNDHELAMSNHGEHDQKKTTIKSSNLRLQVPSPNVPITPRNDSSAWLVQTGLALTESARENKGQSWIVKRDSSVSLYSHSPDRSRSPYTGGASGRNSPNRSRRNSRVRRSKCDLAMTPAAEQAPGVRAEEVQPDWADTTTQAEFAAETMQEERAESVYSRDEWFRDRYGMLDFTGNFKDEEEEEGEDEEEEEGEDEEGLEKDVRDEIRRRKGGVISTWFDGMVDVLLQLEDEPFAADSDAVAVAGKLENDESGDADTNAQKLHNSRKEEEHSEPVAPILQDEVMEPPPENPCSIWEDVGWFGRVVVRTFQS